MPKKYGVTRLVNNRIQCSSCGYSWEPNQEELNDITHKRWVSCLHCRAMNDLKPGQILEKHPNFKLVSTVDGKNPEDLRGDNYQTKKVQIMHDRCKHRFDIELGDLRSNNIVCPYCSSAQKVTPNNIPAKTQGKIVEVEDTAEQLEEGTRLPTNSESKQMGKVLRTGVRVVEMDSKKGSYKIQCIKCGTEEEINPSVLNKVKDRMSLMVCRRCKTQEPSLEALKRQYLGRVFNGQSIEKIYKDEDTGAVLCDLLCLQNKQNTKLSTYIALSKNKDSSNMTTMQMERDIIHVQKRVPLGDAINKRCHCKICGEAEVAKLPSLAAKLGVCKVSVTEKGIIPKINISGMKVNDFYNNINTGSVCDNCMSKDKCKARQFCANTINSYSYISAERDMEDSLLNDLFRVMDNFPSMLQFDKLTPDDIKMHVDKDLIVFKDEYVDMDGRVYKACMCRKHGNQLTLTDAEIAAFNHSQCMENNQYMRLFNLQSALYLTKYKDTDKTGETTSKGKKTARK